MTDTTHRQRRKILMVGHACCPGLGSEPGLTWNWARHMANFHDVCLIAHPHFRDRTEAAAVNVPGLSLSWVDVDMRWDPWRDRRTERGLHLHYILWQRAALARAADLHAVERFDIVHHVSWGTVNAPPGLWRLGLPFVWGPIGGGQAAPLSMRRFLGPAVPKEALRAFRLHLLPFTPALRRAARASAAILATNEETVRLLRRAGARNVDLFLDNGIGTEQLILSPAPAAAEPHRLQLVWIGRIEPRKALPLALAVMHRVRHLPVELTIAGDGPQRAACEALAARLGLSGSVRFLGMIPRDEVARLMARSGALLFTSLQDALGSVVLDAMAAGLPVLCLDHHGVRIAVTPAAGIRVSPRSAEAAVDGLVAGVERLLTSPELRCQMSAAARAQAAAETWPERARRMDQLYRRCMEAENAGAPHSQDHRTSALLPAPLG